ncbi:MAG: S41 family peptidase [Gemmatimonadaceae bacterium]
MKALVAPTVVAVWRRMGIAAAVTLLLLGGAINAAHAQTLSPAQQDSAITAIGGLLRSDYVYDTTGARCADALAARRSSAPPSAPIAATLFAEQITAQLRACANDQHLEVVVSQPAPPAASPSPAPLSAVRDSAPARPWLPPLRRRNFDFLRAERLLGNVGYLEMASFPPPEVAGKTVAGAIAFLANSDALIIDLRQNGGGTGDMVRYLATWFFDDQTAITATWRRADHRLTEDRTLPFVPGERLPRIPLYILTSRGTFSAAEAFAFGLQQLARARVVGDRTRGGANAGRYRNIGAGLRLFVPMANARSPVNGRSWERVGVVPDIAAPAPAALDAAHVAALEGLLKSAPRDSARTRLLEWDLAAARQRLNGTQLTAAQCQHVAGEYQDNRSITCRSSRLYYSLGNEPERELYPLGGNVFFSGDFDQSRLEFAGSSSQRTVIIQSPTGSEETARVVPRR